jgi:hypothetical protein
MERKRNRSLAAVDSSLSPTYIEKSVAIALERAHSEVHINSLLDASCFRYKHCWMYALHLLNNLCECDHDAVWNSSPECCSSGEDMGEDEVLADLEEDERLKWLVQGFMRFFMHELNCSSDYMVDGCYGAGIYRVICEASLKDRFQSSCDRVKFLQEAIPSRSDDSGDVLECLRKISRHNVWLFYTLRHFCDKEGCRKFFFQIQYSSSATISPWHSGDTIVQFFEK